MSQIFSKNKGTELYPGIKFPGSVRHDPVERSHTSDKTLLH